LAGASDGGARPAVEVEVAPVVSPATGPLSFSLLRSNTITLPNTSWIQVGYVYAVPLL
jgi:hypothetical protein